MVRSAALVLVLTSSLCAQYPAGAVGFLWQGTTTPQAGQFCWGFSCNPVPVTVTPGETVTLTVRGDLNMPYVVGTALTATRCLTSPGWYNALVIDDPIVILFQGTLSQPSPILACPSGFDTIIAQLPPSAPVGAMFSLQAAALSGGFGFTQLSFTTPFDVSVL